MKVLDLMVCRISSGSLNSAFNKILLFVYLFGTFNCSWRMTQLNIDMIMDMVPDMPITLGNKTTRNYFNGLRGSSLVAQMVKNPTAMQETWIRSLGWEDPLEEGMATYSSILAWRIPMARGAWWATVHGVTKSDTTE